MKRVLILDDNDFVGTEKRLSSLKAPIKQMEPEYDDIFYNANQRIVCFKARDNKSGEYSASEFISYLLNIN